MKKYAIITINKKPLSKDPFNRRFTRRRVLIEYTSYEDKTDEFIKNFTTRYYKGTRYVDGDDYFKNPESSHKYEFYDDGYSLKSIKLKEDDEFYISIVSRLENVKRDYHRCFKFGNPEDFEFEAPDDDSAKLLFVLKKVDEEKEEN